MDKPPHRTGRMIKIYKITFPDGSAYVGQTRQPVSARLAQHRRSSPCNSILHRRLLIMKPTVEVLSCHRKQEIADREEKKWIMGLEKPINMYVDGKQINTNPRHRRCATTGGRGKETGGKDPSIPAGPAAITSVPGAGGNFRCLSSIQTAAGRSAFQADARDVPGSRAGHAGRR